jgi:serine/threonine-protein kinase RsbW/stage II sporulation protein AB (anti-sigma F factor)
VQSLTESLELDLPADPGSVAEARHAAARLARRFGAEEADVKIAVSEAVGNAVLHAYRGAGEGTVNVKGSLVRGKLVFVVSDTGVGMSPNPDSPGLHLGIPLIGKVAEDIRIDAGANGTTISFSFPVAALG